MTRTKRILCVLLTAAMLARPLLVAVHAAENVIPRQTGAGCSGKLDTGESTPTEQTQQTTPPETEQPTTEEAPPETEAENPTEEAPPEAEEPPTEEVPPETEAENPTEEPPPSEETEETSEPAPETEETTEPEAEPKKPRERFFPDYTLEQYGSTMYASGTILTEGCGITCLAVVATYLTGHTYYPDELASYFGSYGNNNVDRLRYGSDKLKLPYRQAENYHVALDALRKGKIVIQLMNSRSLFTDSQHFIVIKGYNSNGLLEVYDPSGANREYWLLKAGFANGFTEDELCWGFDGAWIYDPEQVPEDPYIYEAPVREYVEPRYDGVQLTEDELDLLARLVWVEARGECAEGQQAVAEVVLNRLISGRFQSSIRGIILDESQFVPRKLLQEAKPGQAQYEAINRALYGPYVLPMEVFFYGTVRITDSVWGKIGGHFFCYSNGYSSQ